MLARFRAIGSRITGKFGTDLRILALLVWLGAQPDPLHQDLENHWPTPEEYLVGTFADHDIVFLGERHWIKQDVELVQRLIPRLHEAGIRRLKLEFLCQEDQALTDRLVTDEQYDEDVARRLFFRGSTTCYSVGYPEFTLASFCDGDI